MPVHHTLQEAADELGVHYMTAYRYVRLGQLGAEKVSGVWRVSDQALVDFREGSGAGPVARGQPAPWGERLEDRLVEGDGQGAWGVIESAMASGADVRSVYVDLLSPAMVSIGARWAAGELDISVEHQATVIATRAIGRLGARCVRRGRPRGDVILGAPAGESHGLATAILSDLMRLHGWNVTDLGANTPTSSFIHALQRSTELQGVGLSVTHSAHLGDIEACCRAIKDAHPDLLVVVGGSGLRGAVADDLGADACVNSADELHELLLAR